MSKTTEAGPELDAEVAEAMGWTAYRERRGEYELAVVVAPGKPKPWERMQNAEQARVRYTQITCHEAVAIGFFGTGFPQASTDWSAAGEVLEQLVILGYKPWLQWLGHTWDCNVHIGWFHAKTGPLAICLAAVNAVRMQES